MTGPGLVERIAVHLTDPEQLARRHRPAPSWRQSLASGALGIALLHVERARTGRSSWGTAHAWLRYAAAGPIDDGPESHLHYGAPALATVLHHAATHHATGHEPRRYARALAVLDSRIAPATTTRVELAQHRIDTGQTPPLAEFDAIRGLTGLGAYWHHRDPHSITLRTVLIYLVRLTEPLPDGRPGWWTHLAPDGRRSPRFPHGHGNNGLAHGIAGPLALLALTHRGGVRVPGHTHAIRRILAWLDLHQQGDDHNRWWPYWTTPSPDAPSRPGRPSWCYGATGIARAQQLAGLALGDTTRTHAAEATLHASITAPELSERLDDVGLCHGTGGALLLARRAAADAPNCLLASAATALQQQVENDPRTTAATRPGAPPDLLSGAAGIALALDDHTDTGPGWDTCLLTS